MSKNVERGVILIKPDERFGFLHTGDVLSLEELQELVGGYIEMVPVALNERWTHERNVRPVMIVNEEWKLLGLARNALATELLRYDICDYVVGDVILSGIRGEEIVPLLRAACEHIAERWLEE